MMTSGLFGLHFSKEMVAIKKRLESNEKKIKCQKTLNRNPKPITYMQLLHITITMVLMK